MAPLDDGTTTPIKTQRHDSATSSPTPSPSTHLEDLKAYLRGLNHSPSLLHTASLSDLHQALYLAAIEIVQRLDPELEATIDMATEPTYSINLDESEFLKDRRIDADGIRDAGLEAVKGLGRGETVELLEEARDEIEWLASETRRLEVHCRNARELRALKLRGSFEYRPLARRGREASVKKEESAEEEGDRHEMSGRRVKEKDGDEEMLDVDETVVKTEDGYAVPFRSWGDVKKEETKD